MKAAVDLSDPGFWAGPIADREDAFRALRQSDGLPFFDLPAPASTAFELTDTRGYYAVARHADVVTASRDADRFCSGRGATSLVEFPPELLEFFGSIINMDDPRHTRLRRIVSAGFTPRMLKKAEDDIQRRAALIAADFAATGEGDFVLEVAARLPLEVICEMMGVPESERGLVFDRSNVVVSNGDPEYIPPGVDFATALTTAAQDLVALMHDLVAQRTKEPQDDLTSALIHANVDDDQLTHAELASFFILLPSAGNETTRNAISHGLWALTEHPDQKRRWADDFETLAHSAVEEIVRWASPIIYMRRTATTDTELGGQELAAGDKVVLLYASANRDEAAFADPSTLDLARTPNEHLGFGAPGPHFCLGAHLARREITVMWRELFRQVPGIRATAEPDRLASNFINGIKHLPCTAGR